jgi:hypothetical protein
MTKKPRPNTKGLLRFVRRRRAGLGHQPVVVVISDTAEEDEAAHRAAGRIGPRTLIVEIVRFGNRPRAG